MSNYILILFCSLIIVKRATDCRISLINFNFTNASFITYIRPKKKIPVFTVTWENSSGRVGRNFLIIFFYLKYYWISRFKCFFFQFFFFGTLWSLEEASSIWNWPSLVQFEMRKTISVDIVNQYIMRRLGYG